MQVCTHTHTHVYMCICMYMYGMSTNAIKTAQSALCLSCPCSSIGIKKLILEKSIDSTGSRLVLLLAYIKYLKLQWFLYWHYAHSFFIGVAGLILQSKMCSLKIMSISYTFLKQKIIFHVSLQ